jgi:hypothetical protein
MEYGEEKSGAAPYYLIPPTRDAKPEKRGLEK